MSLLRVLTGTCVAAAAVTAFYRPPVVQQAAADDHMTHMTAADMAAPPIVAADIDQGAPDLPPSANNAPARLKASSRHAEWVKVAWEPGSKDSLMAWIVYPKSSNPKTPVVVVVHEIYGLSTWVRGVTDQVASEGFIAIAPDLNSRVRGGPSTDELTQDSASKLIRGVTVAEKTRGITAVANFAMKQTSGAPRYAVIGFCWGGGTVWSYAINGGIKGFAGGVAFYGLPPMNGNVPVADSLKKIKTPMMMFSGAKDARTGAGMPGVDSAMKALKKSYAGKNFDGAIHGFVRAQDDPKTARDTVEEKANLAAVKEAWPRTVEFLKKNLGVK